MDNKRVIVSALMFFIFLAMWNGLAGIVDATNSPILQRFSTISTVALTIPVNGDANPYRVAQVRHSAGGLKEGHMLVGNFDKGAKTFAAGSSIMDVAPDGSSSVFSRISSDTLPGACPGGIGPITGLVVLRGGWVIAGIMSQADAASANAKGGCLVMIDSSGKPVETFSGSLINGPSDMAVYESADEAKLFVTNLFTRADTSNGKIENEGSVIRINLNLPANSVPRIASMTVVASGFAEITDPDTLVSGPTGLGLSPGCGTSDNDNCRDYGEKREQLLYVVDSANDRIAVIENALTRTGSAGTGTTLSAGGSLRSPRGLVVAPNGHMLTVNRNDGMITEINADGQQIAKVAAAQYWQTAWGRVPSMQPSYSEFAAIRTEE